MNNSKIIPDYRMKEIMKLYPIFNDKFSNEYNLEYRKTEFKKIIKLKYKWFTNYEYNHIYNLIKILLVAWNTGYQQVWNI